MKAEHGQNERRFAPAARGMVLVCLILFLLPGGCGESPESRGAARVLLATTTSVENSGLLREIREQFHRKTGIEIDALVVGSGKALRLIREGRADVSITHAPEAERDLVAAIRPVIDRAFMFNQFLIAGPRANPAGLAPGDSAVGAFLKIHRSQAAFASRGDESGTHMKEKELWAQASLEPEENAGYVSYGQGMSSLLRSAGETRSYVLTDQATFHQMRDSVDLVSWVTDRPELDNVYSVILPRGENGLPDPDAHRFVEWLLSPDGGELIRGFRIDGRRHFFLIDERAPAGYGIGHDEGDRTNP